MLSSQGWKPGDYLGAENASHGEHYTAANASHIRVMLREDNLGIGAKIGGKGNAETFGLSTLSGIFGRLNGKSDFDVQKQQSSLRDAELRTYQAQKFGYMNFVSGGLLVGDKIEELPDKSLAARTVDGKAAPAGYEAVATKKRKAEADDSEAVPDKSSRKKRKSGVEAELVGTVPDNNLVTEPKKRKKSRTKKVAVEDEDRAVAADASSESDSADAVGPEATEKEEKLAKRERKERRRAERKAQKSADHSEADEKARLKLEKRARKEERRRRKEEKRGLKTAAQSDRDGSQEAMPSVPVSKSEPVDSSGTSTPSQTSLAFGGNRHAVRQRYIMQKRMASMDPRALNEILMIKAQVETSL